VTICNVLQIGTLAYMAERKLSLIVIPIIGISKVVTLCIKEILFTTILFALCNPFLIFLKYPKMKTHIYFSFKYLTLNHSSLLFKHVPSLSWPPSPQPLYSPTIEYRTTTIIQYRVLCNHYYSTSNIAQPSSPHHSQLPVTISDGKLLCANVYAEFDEEDNEYSCFDEKQYNLQHLLLVQSHNLRI